MTQTTQEHVPHSIVVGLARELYDRFIMGGWEPQDSYQLIEEILGSSGKESEKTYAFKQWRSDIALLTKGAEDLRSSYGDQAVSDATDAINRIVTEQARLIGLVNSIQDMWSAAWDKRCDVDSPLDQLSRNFTEDKKTLKPERIEP